MRMTSFQPKHQALLLLALLYIGIQAGMAAWAAPAPFDLTGTQLAFEGFDADNSGDSDSDGSSGSSELDQKADTPAGDDPGTEDTMDDGSGGTSGDAHIPDAGFRGGFDPDKE